MARVVWLTLVLASACAAPNELAVDLHTDLVPGVDFVDIRVSLGQRPEPRAPGAIPGQSALLRGTRLVEYADLAAGEDAVRVELVREGAEPFVIEVPVEIDGATAVTARLFRRAQIVAGHGVSCARLGTRAWCWGAANRIFPDVPPGEIVGPAELPFEVIDICSSFAETCFLDADEALRCVRPGETLSSEEVASHAGHGHVELDCGSSIYNVNRCMRSSDGTVSCSGNDFAGQLGDGPGDSTNRLGDDALAVGVSDAVQLTMGIANACVVTSGGELRCWGFNGGGNLGDGSMEHRFEPVTIDVTNAVRVESFWGTTCALGPLGALRCWGANAAGQIEASPDPVLSPAPITSVMDTRDIAVGEKHICAVRSYGEVRCWGSNTRGQLGDGTTEDRTEPVGGASVLGAVLAIDASAVHTCRLAIEGSEIHAACWGGNESGELGRPPSADVPSPVRVDLPGLYSQ